MNTLQIGGEVMKTLEQANDLVAQLVAENTKLRQDAAKLSDDLDEQKIIAGNWKFRASTALTRLAEFAKQEPIGYVHESASFHLPQEGGHARMNGQAGELFNVPVYAAAGASPVQPEQQQPTSPDVKAALLFALWHHQGGSSKIGQPIRVALGIGVHEHLTPEQLDIAKRVQSAIASQPSQALELSHEDIRKWWASENGLEDMDMCKIDDFTTTVRAIEKLINAKGAAS